MDIEIVYYHSGQCCCCVCSAPGVGYPHYVINHVLFDLVSVQMELNGSSVTERYHANANSSREQVQLLNKTHDISLGLYMLITVIFTLPLPNKVVTQ